MDMLDISKSTEDWMNWETELAKAGRFMNPFGSGFDQSVTHAMRRGLRQVPGAHHEVSGPLTTIAPAKRHVATDIHSGSWSSAPTPQVAGPGSSGGSLSERLREASRKSEAAASSGTQRVRGTGQGRKPKPSRELVPVPREAPASAPRTGRANPIPESSGPTAVGRGQAVASRSAAAEGAPPRTFHQGASHEVPGTGGPVGGEGPNWRRRAAAAGGAATVAGGAALGFRAVRSRAAMKAAEAAHAESAALDAARRRKLLIGAGVGGAGVIGASTLANR